MTSLRQRMTEDVLMQNLALNANGIRATGLSDRKPLQQITGNCWARRRSAPIRCTSPTKKKLAPPSSILTAVGALRFLYKVSLEESLDLRGRHPGAQEAGKTLPIVLEPGRSPTVLRLHPAAPSIAPS